MVEEILVSETLTEEMISAGTMLLRRLDESDSSVCAAFWFFFSEEKVWKLVLSSDLVKTEGPKKYYKRIVDANKKAKDEETIVSLNDIEVTDNSNQILQFFKTVVFTGPGISGIRFSKNTINGMFIDDSYIYRINLKM